MSTIVLVQGAVLSILSFDALISAPQPERNQMARDANKTAPKDGEEAQLSRIQQRNRGLILNAALDVFSQHGFRGATLDQIADGSGLSKPNILYYFDGKEDIHVTLLNQLMDRWLAPLREIDKDGAPLEELMRYVHRKLEMSQTYPRESRLFANEILQGAPRIAPHLEADLRPLVDASAALIEGWIAEGKLAPVDARHLIFSIWATTQHYADFEVQVKVLTGGADVHEGAKAHLDALFRRLLTPLLPAISESCGREAV